MGQNIFDLAVVVVLALFAIRGVRNGFIVEIAGIFALIAGFWTARAWSADLAPRVAFISDPGLRPLAACVIIFVATMIAVGLAARILKKIVSFSFIGWLDKLAGFVLGLTKGAVIWALAFIVLDKIMPDAEFMRDSRAVPYFSMLVEQIKEFLPPDLADRLS